jgi:hypothetical protein
MGGGRKMREWMRKKLAMVARGQQSPRWTLRLRRNRPAVLQLLYQNVIFYLLWVIESIVVLAKLCFFFLRFGFRL